MALVIPIGEAVQHESCELDPSDVPEIIASAPKTDEQPAILLREPVSHDRDHAGEEECIENADEDLHEVKVGLAVDFEEAG